jgi:hypothetical protein
LAAARCADDTGVVDKMDDLIISHVLASFLMPLLSRLDA